MSVEYFVPSEYWHANPKRWHRVLSMAADFADMYELERPSAVEMERWPVWRLTERFFWNTTHARVPLSCRVKGPIHDPMTDVDPAYDAPTCWACIMGEAELMGLSRMEAPFVFDTSSERVSRGRAAWMSYSPDFRRMIRGLSGDLKNKALRSLVLGEYRRDGNA